MATILGGRIISVEAKRDKFEPVKGMGIDVKIEDIGADKEMLTVQYSFTVTYNDNVGRLKIGGLLNLKEEDAKKAKEIAKEWKDSGGKKLPNDFSEVVMNGIAYACAVSGALFTQPLGLNAPMMLMPIKLRPVAPEAKLPPAPKPMEGAA